MEEGKESLETSTIKLHSRRERFCWKRTAEKEKIRLENGFHDRQTAETLIDYGD